MNFFLFALMLLLLIGCGENLPDMGYKPDAVSAIINEIEKKVFYQLLMEKKLYPCEFGGGGKNPIELVHFGLLYFDEIEIKEARELIMAAGDQFLKEINTNEQIRPYLVKFPFEPKNIQVKIFLKNPDGSEIGLEKLHVIVIRNGKIKYFIRSLETKRLTTIYEETYEEAKAKLIVQTQSTDGASSIRTPLCGQVGASQFYKKLFTDTKSSKISLNNCSALYLAGARKHLQITWQKLN